MTKNEFLDKLRKALGNDLNGSAVQENTAYYQQYIMDEVNKGRREEEVIDELGDPWVIARTIIDASDAAQGPEGGYADDADRQVYGQGYGSQGGYVKRTDVSFGKWKLAVMLLGIIGVLIAVIAVIGGIISLVAPILIPVFFIMIIIRIFGRRR